MRGGTLPTIHTTVSHSAGFLLITRHLLPPAKKGRVLLVSQRRSTKKAVIELCSVA